MTRFSMLSSSNRSSFLGKGSFLELQICTSKWWRKNILVREHLSQSFHTLPFKRKQKGACTGSMTNCTGTGGGNSDEILLGFLVTGEVTWGKLYCSEEKLLMIYTTHLPQTEPSGLGFLSSFSVQRSSQFSESCVSINQSYLRSSSLAQLTGN